MQIHTPTPEPEKQALNSLMAAMKESQKLQDRASADLEAVKPFLIDALAQCHGGANRLRHILWSVYNCSHLVNLGDALSGMDAKHAHAALALLNARLALGGDCEESLREILTKSGEFDRFRQTADRTPEPHPVIYPHPQVDSRTLRELADALDAEKRD